MNLQNFYQKWQSKTVEDYGSYMSPSAKQFANNIKAVIKEIAISLLILITTFWLEVQNIQKILLVEEIIIAI